MIWPFGIATFVCRVFRLFNEWFYIIPGLITIIGMLINFTTQVNLKVLKEVFLTFRAIVTSISLLGIIICDISRLFLNFETNNTELWVTTIMDLVIYVGIVARFSTTDAWRNVTRFTRFFGPAIMVAVSIQNFYFLETEDGRWQDSVVKLF